MLISLHCLSLNQWIIVALCCFGYYFRVMVDSFRFVRTMLPASLCASLRDMWDTIRVFALRVGNIGCLTASQRQSLISVEME